MAEQFKMIVEGIQRTVYRTAFETSLAIIVPASTNQYGKIIELDITNVSSSDNVVEVVALNPSTRLYGAQNSAIYLQPQDEGGRMQFPLSLETAWFTSNLSEGIVIVADDTVSGTTTYYYEDG